MRRAESDALKTMMEAEKGTARAAWVAARRAALDGATWGEWRAEMVEAAWRAASQAFLNAGRGVEEVNGLAAFEHPATGRLARIWLPIVDAYEAGLFLYWIMPDEVICVLQPVRSIVDGRLHRADGPAVSWPSGEAYHFWRGVQVPTWVIEEPHRITVEEIRSAPNQEVRRCMTEIYGLSRYLRDPGARLAREDEYGRLWGDEGR